MKTIEKINQWTAFGHLADTLLLAGKMGGFKVYEGVHRAVVTGFKASGFNYIDLGCDDDSLLKSLMEEQIPFICLPAKSFMSEYESFCKRLGLKKTADITAHRFSQLGQWTYTPNDRIEIKRINSVENLDIFDQIASEVFGDPRGMTMQFLVSMLNTHLCDFFLAYYEGEPVATGMVSYANNLAGCYWDAVLPQYRNKGIATALTQYRMQEAKTRGFDSICVQNMPSSIGYYQRIGFEPVGTVSMYRYEPLSRL